MKEIIVPGIRIADPIFVLVNCMHFNLGSRRELEFSSLGIVRNNLI